MTSQKRRKHQRKINNYIRKLNKTIEQDGTYKGRFFIQQCGYPIFKDNVLYVRFKLVDKDTNETCFSDYHPDNHWGFMNGTALCYLMNEFILRNIYKDSSI